MNSAPSTPARLDELLAGLLRYGTWLASAAIGLGLALALIEPQFMRLASVGIVLFILLPTARVALMLAIFFRARDYRLAIVAALVLAIIVLGLFLGASSRTPAVS